MERTPENSQAFLTRREIREKFYREMAIAAECFRQGDGRASLQLAFQAVYLFARAAAPEADFDPLAKLGEGLHALDHGEVIEELKPTKSAKGGRPPQRFEERIAIGTAIAAVEIFRREGKAVGEAQKLVATALNKHWPGSKRISSLTVKSWANSVRTETTNGNMPPAKKSYNRAIAEFEKWKNLCEASGIGSPTAAGFLTEYCEPHWSKVLSALRIATAAKES